jgi:uncharacterized protein (DUF1501 family)
MLSRRVFLKNGAFAFVSLGFAVVHARTAVAASGRSKQLIAIFQRGAVDGLSVVVPHGESEVTAARGEHRDSAPNGGDAAAVDLDGFFGFNPKLQPLKPLWDRRSSRSSTRAGRRQHAVAFRRAGLHGERDARREKHR